MPSAKSPHAVYPSARRTPAPRPGPMRALEHWFMMLSCSAVLAGCGQSSSPAAAHDPTGEDPIGDPTSQPPRAEADSSSSVDPDAGASTDAAAGRADGGPAGADAAVVKFTPCKDQPKAFCDDFEAATIGGKPGPAWR